MAHPTTPLKARMGVLHRTIGTYPGDLRTLSGRTPSCHFLIGRDPGQWCQMVPVNIVANHAAGANGRAFGVELSGRVEDPLSSWQVDRLAQVLVWARQALGIPAQLYTGARTARTVAGWINHGDILAPPGKAHTDRVTAHDWARVLAIVDGPILVGGPSGPPLDVLEDLMLVANPLPILIPNAFGAADTIVEFGRPLLSVQGTINGPVLIGAGVAAEVYGTTVRLAGWGLRGPTGVHVWAMPAP